jgi:hypothetical protein
VAALLREATVELDCATDGGGLLAASTGVDGFFAGERDGRLLSGLDGPAAAGLVSPLSAPIVEGLAAVRVADGGGVGAVATLERRFEAGGAILVRVRAGGGATRLVGDCFP